MTVSQALIISVTFLLLAGFYIYFTIVFNRRVIKHNTDLNTIKEEQDKLLLKASIETQELERNRIGANIHDDVGPLLSLLKLRINSLLDKSNNIHESEIEKLNESIDHIISQIQKISKELVPSILYELGLETALINIIKRIENISAIQFSYVFKVNFSDITNLQSIGIFRVIQESLNNILKHAHASKINLVLKETSDDIILQIEDNGIGFDVDTKHNGLGLKNIQARVRSLGGKYLIQSNKGTGTEIKISIPKNNDTKN